MANYLLLRDNKESGPFAAEDLVKMGLKPYDLVWVQGKSAAWRYPSEIDELKPYAPEVEEQPFDRFYKKPAATETAQQAIQPVKQAATVNDQYEAYLPKLTTEQEQPVKKRSVFVTMPGQVAERKVAVRPTPVTKPKPAPTPIPDYTLPEAEETISITENPVAKINYSQPLDEIKEMYVKTLKDRKDKIARKSFLKISLKRAAVVAGLIGIGLLAGFILKSRPAANAQLAQQLPVTNTLAVTNDQQQTTPQQPPSQETQTIDPPAETTPNDQPVTQPVTAAPQMHDKVAAEKPQSQRSAPAPITGSDEPRPKKEKTSLPAETAEIKDTRKPLAVMPSADTRKKENQEEYAAAETNPVTGERTKTVRMVPPPVSSNEKTSRTENELPSSTRNTTTASTNALSGLGDKVSVSSNDYKRVALGGIRNLELTVSNHSKYDLDEVAVELQYLKPGDQILKTQIVQFKSVGANNTETLRIPDTNRGVKVQFRIVRIGSSQLVDR
ncbi:MAG: hypothetical protein DI535_26515 [Citrobacter freundii]|nr:MAG: hypothetical protein DI535_26515 [Citrobacter freundii]